MSGEFFLGRYPTTRPRRNRQHPWSQRLSRETRLSADNLIWPVFVHDAEDAVQPISSMPGVSRYSLKQVAHEVKRAYELGIPAVALFPNVDRTKRNPLGSEATNPNNLICRAIAEVKEHVPGIGLICDVALDPFTDHGHDGILIDGRVNNDETVKVLVQQAIVQARAGCDVIAPSDMMDGRVGEIRAALDNAGFTNTIILSYAAKYASAFYGPFRDAIGSNTLVGRDKELGYRDKSTYQMDPANTDEALREVALDLEEGADMVMVKPGMPYLDIVQRVKETFRVPTCVYQVSGEYAALCAAADNGWVDRKRIVMESLLCFRRAGADGILTYFAREAAAWLDKP
ncbi:MAG: porphobilinogen synthase [Pseudomonadota bacterium]